MPHPYDRFRTSIRNRRRRLSDLPLARFLRTEAGGGAVLLAATVAALLWANSPWHHAYHSLWGTTVAVGPGSWALRQDLHHWVNDALMAIFFFLIGLEIKRELVVGELRDPRAMALPVLAAAGGMVLPAALFLAVAGGTEAARGWGIPMATDIAFVIGVLALLGGRAPPGLKVFLLTLAIVDDIGAIAVIALFYSTGLAAGWLGGAAVALGAVLAARGVGLVRPLAYVPLALAAWYCTYRAGVHPTIAAVALGLLTPARPVGERRVLEDLEERLHPWSTYVAVPLFALANAGVSLDTGTLADAATSRLTWAVAVGLVVGKTLGIAGVASLAVRTRIGVLPPGADLGHMLGAGALGGVGFTVSLFVTTLAFSSPALEAQAKIGILSGSFLAAVVGVALLLRQSSPAAAEDDTRCLTPAELEPRPLGPGHRVRAPGTGAAPEHGSRHSLRLRAVPNLKIAGARAGRGGQPSGRVVFGQRFPSEPALPCPPASGPATSTRPAATTNVRRNGVRWIQSIKARACIISTLAGTGGGGRATLQQASALR
jgi:Na+:H+ antiporter, NhaA family